MRRRLRAAAIWAGGGVRLPLAAGAVALAIYAGVGADAYAQRLLAIAGVYALLVIGYQFIFGHGGALSLAQAAFFGLGAYVTAILATRYGLSFAVTFPLSLALPAAVAALVALPVLRLETHYFALATLVIAQALWLGAVNWESLTGGANGLPSVPGAALAGIEIAAGPGELIFVWVLVAGGAALAWQVARGLYGGCFRVVREEPLAAAAAGIDADRLRFAAYVLSSAYGGAAGALHAHIIGVASPESLELPVLIACLTMAVVGGRTRIAGAVIAAVLLVHLPEWFRFLGDHYLIAYGAATLLVIVLAPEGIVGFMEALRRRLAPEPAPPPPAPIALPPRAASSGTREETLLESRGLVKAFGGVAAVDGVSLAVQRGEICGLIGPNGSGKTTLVNLVTGLYAPDAGRVAFKGRDVTGWRPWRLARAGIGRSFQSAALVEGLSALDNVAVARAAAEGAGVARALSTLGGDRRLARARGQAMALLDKVGAGDAAMRPPAELPLGLRRGVEIARALALAPELLILDEPAAGLAEPEQVQLAGLIRRLNGEGLTLLVIEHNMPFLMKLADRLACLDEGRLIAVGPAAEVRNDPRVVAAYLGAAASEDGR